MKRQHSGGLVYSTDVGRICPGCREAVAHCTCGSGKPRVAPGDGVVRVARETKGRGGKCVTTVRGVPLAAEALEDLARRLKAACGAGGTVKEGVIEIQGDHGQVLAERLAKEGWKVKRG